MEENVTTTMNPNPNEVEMTITEGLAKMTMLKKRLSKNDNIKNLFSVVVGVESKLPNGQTQEEFDETIKSAYKSYMTLFENYKILKRAINKANMENKITFAGEEYTVAEVLAMRSDNVIGKYKDIISNLKTNYRNMVAANDKATQTYQKDLNNYIKELCGKQFDAVSAGAEITEENGYKSAIEFYEKKNKPVLLDPLDLKKEIEDLEALVEEYENEIDYRLSTFNATHKIKVVFAS